MNMFFVDPRECNLAKAKTFSGQAPIRQLAGRYFSQIRIMASAKVGDNPSYINFIKLIIIWQ